LISLAVGVLPSLPGFLVNIKVLPTGTVASLIINSFHIQKSVAVNFDNFLVGLYNYAWFVGFGIAFIVYLAGKKLASASSPASLN